MRKVPRPPTWLVVAGWALMGLGWLSDAKAFIFLSFSVFAALILWLALWLGQRGRHEKSHHPR
jgi:hypothetical protein